MNITFPADHELLAFFGADPKILDPNVPWFYNTLHFEVKREGIVVQCRLVPACGDIDVRLHVGGTELARLNLRSFEALRIYMTTEEEILVATFDREYAKETFSLMLKPRVWVGFGSFQSIPPSP
jgi:hypothetical protein